MSVGFTTNELYEEDYHTMEQVLSLPILNECSLFEGITTPDLTSLLGCLKPSIHQYEKHQFVFRAGENVTAVGVVLTGNVHVLQEDAQGSRTILNHVAPGGLFGEAFACTDVQTLPISVMTTEPSTIMLLDYRRIMTTCSSQCAFHSRMIRNMMQILARTSVMLTQKIENVTKRTTRDKLLTYLTEQAQQAGSNAFGVPFNRQELADYLSVDRSAMSAELSKMQGEGIIKFHKNRFELL
jgi:CRP-like cAMP-binding protein